MNLNKVQLIGRLGRDPEVKYMQSGDAVTNFSLATSESWKDKNSGERKEATEWHTVVAYGRLAEIAGEYQRKGHIVYVEGKLKTRKWQDQNGNDRYTTEVHASSIQMLPRSMYEGGGASSGGNGGYGGGQPQQQQQRQPQQQRQQPQQQRMDNMADMDDDIPF